VAEGTPEEVAKVSASYTGQFLAEILESNRKSNKPLTPVKKKTAAKKK
jgi:excinuclease ABC subunit A